MARVKVYGASDDLIEVEGDLRDEFGAYGDKEKFLHFSEGTVLGIRYGKDGPDLGGIWAVRVAKAGTARVTITECIDEDADPYSDVAVVEGDFDPKQIDCWENLEISAEEVSDKLADLMDNAGPHLLSRVSVSLLLQVYRALRVNK